MASTAESTTAHEPIEAPLRGNFDGVLLQFEAALDVIRELSFSRDQVEYLHRVIAKLEAKLALVTAEKDERMRELRLLEEFVAELSTGVSVD